MHLKGASQENTQGASSLQRVLLTRPKFDIRPAGIPFHWMAERRFLLPYNGWFSSRSVRYSRIRAAEEECDDAN
jgi:hypothetical protein